MSSVWLSSSRHCKLKSNQQGGSFNFLSGIVQCGLLPHYRTCHSLETPLPRHCRHACSMLCACGTSYCRFRGWEVKGEQKHQGNTAGFDGNVLSEGRGEKVRKRMSSEWSMWYASQWNAAMNNGPYCSYLAVFFFFFNQRVSQSPDSFWSSSVWFSLKCCLEYGYGWAPSW